MLKRKAYDTLLKWKHESAGKTALLIEGARRVGKSTLARTFGETEYKSCLVIDFFQAPAEVKQYFEDYRTDFDSLFLYLSVFYNVKLYEHETLIVFDEVQMYPQARGLIKYLVADGRYDYIETGSLLSIKQNIKDIVIPSEEESLELEPLDFEEFLWGMDEKGLADLIRMSLSKMKPLPDALHRRALSLMREYMLVGGMPEPVSIYVEQRAFAPVDASKRRIVQLYRNDISRFATSPYSMASRVNSLGTKSDSSFPHLIKTRACAPTKKPSFGWQTRELPISAMPQASRVWAFHSVWSKQHSSATWHRPACL